MVQVQLLKTISNDLLRDNVTLAEVPHEGEFIMLSEEVKTNWKELLYKVVNVTYLIGNRAIVHVDKYDPEKELESYNKVLEKLLNGTKQKVSEMEKTRES